MTNSALVTALASLQRLEGVAGSLLYKGRNVVHRQMPFSEGRTHDLIQVLSEMLEGYWQVNRKIRQLFMQFDGGSLLVLVQERSVLVFFLTSRSDTDLIASAGTVLMRDFALALAELDEDAVAVANTAAPQIEELIVTTPRMAQQRAQQKDEARITNWGTLRKQLEALLGKVMGRAQVVSMIDRLIAKQGIDDPYRAQPAQLRALAEAVINQVPNTAKRNALMSELEPILAEHSL